MGGLKIQALPRSFVRLGQLGKAVTRFVTIRRLNPGKLLDSVPTGREPPPENAFSIFPTNPGRSLAISKTAIRRFALTMHDFAFVTPSRSSLNGAIESKQSTATGVLYVPIQFMATERLYKISPGEELRIGSAPDVEMKGNPDTLLPHAATIRIQDGKLIVINVALGNRVVIESRGRQKIPVTDTPVELKEYDEIYIEGLFYNVTLGSFYRADLPSDLFRERALEVIEHPSLYRDVGGTLYAVKTNSVQYTHVIQSSEPATVITDLPHFEDNELANQSDTRFQYYRPKDGMRTDDAAARFYIPLEPTVSSQDRNRLITELWEFVRQNPKSAYFKVRKTLRSRDAIVVFFNHAGEKVVADAVITITKTFDPTIYAKSGPAFTQRIAPGVYFGQNPNEVQEFDILGHQKDVSFSTLRGEAMAQAWEIIVKTETPGHPLNVDEKMAIIAHVFKKRDINTENPAFNASGPTTFQHIQELIRQGSVRNTDWNVLAESDYRAFLQTVYDRLVSLKTEIKGRIDQGDDAESIRNWFQSTIKPELMAIGEIFSLKNYPRSFTSAKHDLSNQFLGLTYVLIDRLVAGDLQSVRTLCDISSRSVAHIVTQLGIIYAGRADVRGKGIDELILPSDDDVKLLYSILDNLIRNAAEHPASDQKEVIVEVDHSGGQLIIRDNGSGMDATTVQKIRDGVRIHNAKEVTAANQTPDTQDHGFGWQSIRETCRALGILWAIESTPGAGTTVTLKLPRKVDWEALAQPEDLAEFHRELYLFLDQFKAEMIERLDAKEDPKMTAEWLGVVFVQLRTIEKVSDDMLGRSMAQYKATGRDSRSSVFRQRMHDIGALLQGKASRVRRWKYEIASGTLDEADVRDFCNTSLNTLGNLKRYVLTHYPHVKVSVSFIADLGSLPANTIIGNDQTRRELQSIVDNLILNAIRHGGKPLNEIVININVGGRHTHNITIKDNGVGMDAKTLAAIQGGQRISEGQELAVNDASTIHGNGWQSIRRNCDALGINWTVDSELGNGTTVTLNLPDRFLRDAFLPESSFKSREAIKAIRWAVEGVDMEALMLAIKEYIEVTRAEVRQLLDSGEDYAAVYERVFRPEYEQFMVITGALVLPENARIRDIHHDLIHEYGRLSVAMDLAALFSEGLPKLRLLVSPPTRSIDGMLKRLEAPMKGIIRSGVKENRMIADSVDLDSFERILANLVGNAEGHPRVGERTVVINVKLVGNRLVIQDKGAGMDVVTLNHIRQGIRVHDGEVITSGNHGHGWHSIRDLCKKLGITWEVDSKLGVGTVVTLTLPDGFITI